MRKFLFSLCTAFLLCGLVSCNKSDNNEVSQNRYDKAQIVVKADFFSGSYSTDWRFFDAKFVVMDKNASRLEEYPISHGVNSFEHVIDVTKFPSDITAGFVFTPKNLDDFPDKVNFIFCPSVSARYFYKGQESKGPAVLGLEDVITIGFGNKDRFGQYLEHQSYPHHMITIAIPACK